MIHTSGCSQMVKGVAGSPFVGVDGLCSTKRNTQNKNHDVHNAGCDEAGQ
jgi:hypothetical protein